MHNNVIPKAYTSLLKKLIDGSCMLEFNESIYSGDKIARLLLIAME